MASGAIVSSIIGGDATRSAANTAADAQLTAMQMQKQMYDDAIRRQQPFYEQGIKSLGDYDKMLHGGYDMQQSPAAMYEQQQGAKMMNRQLAARGQLGSGLAANRMTELSSGIAAKDWGNQYSRILDSLKLATGAAGSMGQSGATYGNQAQSGATNLGNIYQNEGQNRASMYQNIGNSMSNAGATFAGLGIKRGWGSTPSYSESQLTGGQNF
jgi:hypothetical protein